MKEMPYKYPRESKYAVRVGQSSAGLGLFAKEEIPKGSFLILLTEGLFLSRNPKR